MLALLFGCSGVGEGGRRGKGGRGGGWGGVITHVLEESLFLHVESFQGNVSNPGSDVSSC